MHENKKSKRIGCIEDMIISANLVCALFGTAIPISSFKFIQLPQIIFNRAEIDWNVLTITIECSNLIICVVSESSYDTIACY